MIRLFALALLSASSMTSAFAAEFSISSTVEKVTVYPRGASVTRTAKLEVPKGDHVIVVGNLPEDVQPDSVRVKGIATGQIVQNSVDVKRIAVTGDAQPAERLRLERQIEELQGESARLDRLLSDNELQRQLLQALASRAMTPASGENGGIGFSGEALSRLLESASGKLDALGQSEMEALARQREIVRSINDIQIRIGELSPPNRVETIVSINVAAQSAAEGSFEIEYKIDQAGWQPVYDANLILGDTADGAKVDLNRRAQVRNASGEIWDNVQLALSTSRPSSATSAPELATFEIDEVQPEYYRSKEERDISNGLVLMDSIAPAAPVARKSFGEAEVLEEAPIAIDYGGFQAVFHIPGRTSIDNTGEVKSVGIDQQELKVDLYATSVPRIDPAAYLVAGIDYTGETPLLPGQVLLSRDGVFIGKGILPMISSGEKHELGFGVDDQVRIERVETDKLKGESGFVSTVRTDERRFLTTVQNLHDFPMKIAVLDRLPVSNHEDIVVEVISGWTQPTKTNVDDRRGILEWSNLVPAKGKQEISFGYKVQWPTDMKVGLIN